MRHKAALGGLLALLGVVAAAFGGEDVATTVTFGLKRPDGKATTKADTETVVAVLGRRLNGAGLEGIKISADACATVTLKVPGALSARRDEIASLAERPGTIEFRIVASADETKKWRQISEELDGPLVAPKRFAWVPSAADRPEYLVVTPERPITAHIEKLLASGLPDDDVVVESLRGDLERVRRDEVFTGDQLQRVEMHRQSTQVLVYFAFREDRKTSFGEFTERHVKDLLAIILDGKVESAPVIRSRLPGEGIIEGGGAAGFTEREARELATVLNAGALPVRLVRLEAPEKK
jgi:preprotein translocase subunit SecD